MKKLLNYFIYIGVSVLVALNLFRIVTLDIPDDAPSDYRSLFVGGKYMFDGTALYDTTSCMSRWQTVVKKEQLNSLSSPGQIHIAALTYPPHAYPIFSFNHLLTWKQGRVVWWTICFICFGVLLYGLKSPLMMALAIGFKGSFFAMLLGQPMLFVVAMIVLLMKQLRRKTYMFIALLLMLSLIKFTLVIPLIIWLAVKKKWNTLFFTGLFATGVYGFLLFCFPSIIGDYLLRASEYYSFIYSSAANNLYPTLNSELTSFINVFTPLSMPVINGVNVMGQLVGYGMLVVLFYRKKIDQAWLLYLLYLVSFLFSYHLIYDALVLLLPMSMIHLNRPERPYVYLLPFVILSLPWNALVSYVPLAQYHFPILLMLALIMALYDRLLLEKK